MVEDISFLVVFIHRVRRKSSYFTLCRISFLFSAFTLNIMLARGTFVDDLYQIEGIFLCILFASIQIIILVFPLPSQVSVYFPIIYCDILFSDILFSYILFSISVMKYISYFDLFFQHLCLLLMLMVVG